MTARRAAVGRQAGGGDDQRRNQAMCSGKGNLLDRSKLPATGILIDKIHAQPGGVCGSPMPLGGPMLPQEDLDCLQAWANGLVNSVGP